MQGREIDWSQTFSEMRALLFEASSCANPNAHHLRVILGLEPEMDEAVDAVFSDDLIEILPPEPRVRTTGAGTCLCCCRLCSTSDPDEDGCGICDQCLAP